MTLAPALSLPVKGTPRQHQLDGAAFALRPHPATALLHEMGCGKTLTTIGVAGIRYAQRDITRLLVVCPATVLDVWKDELELWADYPYEVRLLMGTMSRRRDMLEARWESGPLQIAVVNYEAVWRMYDTVRDWVGEVGMVVADESPRIKAPGSKQSKALHNLGRVVPYRMWNSGTPVAHSPLDVYSQWKFGDPPIFGTSFVSFKNQYAIERQMRQGWRLVVGYRNLDDLARKAHSVAHRVRRADVLDLPAALDVTRHTALEGQAQRIYRELARDSIARIDETGQIVVTNILTKLLRLSQLTGGFLENPDTGRVQQVSSVKLAMLEDTLQDVLEDDHKVVVFTRFRAELAAIQDMMRRRNWGFETLDGSTPMAQRGEIINRFSGRRDIPVFLAQIQAGGVGLNLQAADTVIFYSLDYSYMNYEQAKSRIYRDGQTRPCTFYHLIVRGTVDEKVMRALETKRDLADLVVDNWRELFDV